jgi:hypothetical protein
VVEFEFEFFGKKEPQAVFRDRDVNRSRVCFRKKQHLRQPRVVLTASGYPAHARSGPRRDSRRGRAFDFRARRVLCVLPRAGTPRAEMDPSPALRGGHGVDTDAGAERRDGRECIWATGTAGARGAPTERRMTERTRCDLLQVPCKEGKTIAQIDADSRTHPLRLLPLCLPRARAFGSVSLAAGRLLRPLSAARSRGNYKHATPVTSPGGCSIQAAFPPRRFLSWGLVFEKEV